MTAFSSFMTHHWVCNNSSMTSATCGAKTANHFRVPWFAPPRFVLIIEGFVFSKYMSSRF